MQLEELSDKLEINELLARYCHSLDEKDWPSFRAIFTDDASIDFTAFGGPQGSVAELETFLVPILDGLAGSQHTVSTIKIDLDGDLAKARSAAIVPMTTINAEGVESTFISGLWYEDHLARTQNGWRIQSRKQVRGWASSPI
ncbi:nuclear transport factor 2 family protein [Sphingobium sp. ZW T5_29]|uniref:nuclear transport factor 2 family protein n=1 Tax=Sphingobium sp. ZW T5_29 TaxID=3378077 RepID=UPI0038555C85